MKGENQKRSINRHNVLIVIIYVIGAILTMQLFNLQIIQGKEYREYSNSRLTRETTIKASRGSILDRNGEQLATTQMGFSLDLYKTKLDVLALNNNILNMINVLEKNQDTYVDSFPIKVNPIEFIFSSDEDGQKALNWKKKNKIGEELNAEESLEFFKEKYEIKNENIQDVRKIIGIRYELSQQGYSSTKSLQISNNISRESVMEISERSENFPGFYISIQPIRKYEKGTLLSHVIGYTNKITQDEYGVKKEQGYSSNDLIGRSGIEGVFEEYLKGKDGLKLVDMDAEGTLSGEYVETEAEAGSDIVLTIDTNLQDVTEKALAENIKKINEGGFNEQFDTDSGAAIVMDVKTGEILAMASFPDYDPSAFVNGISLADWEKYNNPKTKPMYNRAIQGSYAPGSIFKMITAVAGLESKATTTSEKIIDLGQYDKGHKPVCWIYGRDGHSTHGAINTSDAIKVSCNYYFYEIGYRMGIDVLEKYARYFGLGEKTGIELYGENSGILASTSYAQSKDKTWYLSDTLSASIGQSYTSTSVVQMANYISILVNGGKRIQPTLVKEVLSNGKEQDLSKVKEEINKKLGINEVEHEDLKINQQNLDAILEGMKSVTGDAGGTAYTTFKDFPIEVGGKTGTAQTSTSNTNAWFVGFAPYDNPEIAVVIIAENGGHGYYTADAALKIFEEYFGLNMEEVIENNTMMDMTNVLR